MDEKKINQLYMKYNRKIYNIALSYVKDPYLSEDISQEVLIKCYYKFDKFKGECSLNTWVNTVTKNHCIDYIRSNLSKTILPYEDLDYLFNERLTPEDMVLFQNEKEILTKEVIQLPNIYKDVIILFYFNDYSLKEIKDILKINISTVKTRLYRAKQLLSKSYDIEDKYFNVPV